MRRTCFVRRGLVLSMLLAGLAMTAQANLVGQWLCDEVGSPTICDSSGNGNFGTLAGGASFSTDTPFVYGRNYSLALDGVDGSADMGDPASGVLDFGTGSFTVMAWVKSSAADNNDQILNKKIYGSSGYSLFIEGSGTSRRARFLIHDGASQAYRIGPTHIVDGAWHHVAGVVDRSTNQLRLYVDGVQDGLPVDVSTVGSVDTTAAFHIGRYDGATDRRWPGLIDEVRVEDRALSLAEIQQYASNPLAAPAGLWLLDEGTGTTAIDSSPNTNTGTIHGATYVGYSGNDALRFDGVNDYVNCGNDSSLNVGDGSFSVLTWIKTDKGGNNDTILSKRPSGGGGYSLFLESSGANVVGRFYLRGTKDGGSNYTADWVMGGPNLVDGEWHQVVGVYDASANEAYLYVDGYKYATDTSMDVGDLNSTGILTLGAGYGGTNYFFPGQIGEAMVIGRALVAGEILYNFENTEFVPEPCSMLLLGAGLTALAARRRTRRKA